MTDPNVLGGDYYGLKFIFDSGNTEMKHLFRPYDSANGRYYDSIESLLEPSGAGAGGGTKYVVPASRVFYMLQYSYASDSTSDISLAIQRNSTVDNTALGMDLYKTFIEGSTGGTLKPYDCIVGGLQFNAGEYVTPYNQVGSGNLRWAFQSFGVECDA